MLDDLQATWLYWKAVKQRKRAAPIALAAKCVKCDQQATRSVYWAIAGDTIVVGVGLCAKHAPTKKSDQRWTDIVTGAADQITSWRAEPWKEEASQ